MARSKEHFGNKSFAIHDSKIIHKHHLLGRILFTVPVLEVNNALLKLSQFFVLYHALKRELSPRSRPPRDCISLFYLCLRISLLQSRVPSSQTGQPPATRLPPKKTRSLKKKQGVAKAAPPRVVPAGFIKMNSEQMCRRSSA